jgi:PHD/YefM family antitoxin component YafN of YafNO toxin-antitoxin module
MSAVLETKEQFIVNASGKRVGVVLDLSTYERLREAEEELDDIRAYDAVESRVKTEIAKGDFVTLADYKKARTAKRK